MKSALLILFVVVLMPVNAVANRCGEALSSSQPSDDIGRLLGEWFSENYHFVDVSRETFTTRSLEIREGDLILNVPIRGPSPVFRFENGKYVEQNGRGRSFSPSEFKDCLGGSYAKMVGQDTVPSALPDSFEVTSIAEDTASKPVQSDTFTIGGLNSTESIRKLTEINGIPIATLEQKMRPGADSQAGFLGTDESLIDVMVKDNELVVDSLSLTHQEIADALESLLSAGRQAIYGTSVSVNGVKFRVELIGWGKAQESPFGDETFSSIDFNITNLTTNESIRGPGLIIETIRRYGFYEGEGTIYRVDPEKLIKILNLKPN